MNAGLPAHAAGCQEAHLIDRARNGDRSAFGALYRAHHRRVYALCRRLVADAGLAEDLTQDVFVKAWRELGGFRGAAQLSTWLHRVAVNTVLSHQRRMRPWLARLRDDEGEAEARVHDPSPGAVRDLERAIDRLPRRAREVFVLVDVEGYSHEEAARALGVAVGTSKAQLHRARGLLREMLT
jgi:RNA polymerase sigma-70 factor, ECF subfamily